MDLVQQIILILTMAVCFDFIIGEPPNKIHTVVGIGKIISFLTKKIKKRGRKEGEKREKRYGIILGLTLTTTIGILSYVLLIQVSHAIGTYAFIIISAYILKTTFSIKSMDKHVDIILTELKNKNIEKARINLSMIVSRETSYLTETNILSACIECIAESYVDGITSPLFYYGILNIPGSIIFRTINTLDSMIAYKDEYYKDIGWMSAKLDTLFNYIPARLSAIFLILSSFLLGLNWKNAISIYKRDSKNTESINAGIPMSIMAGALNIQLEKINHYKLGDMLEQINIDKCRDTLKVTKIASLMFIIIYLIPIIIFFNILHWWTIFFD